MGKPNCNAVLHSRFENLYFTRMNISGRKTTENNKLTNLTININSEHVQHNIVLLFYHVFNSPKHVSNSRKKQQAASKLYFTWKSINFLSFLLDFIPLIATLRMYLINII